MERIYSAHKAQKNLSTLDKPKSFNTTKLLQVFLEIGKYNGAGKYDGL